MENFTKHGYLQSPLVEVDEFHIIEMKWAGPDDAVSRAMLLSACR